MIKSTVMYTEEIDDLETAAEELFSQTSDFERRKNTIAIIYMDVDTEYPELYELLREKWDFPIVASTAVGMLNNRTGYSRSGISVMLLTSDDCRFAAGITEKLSAENYAEEIKKTYEALEKSLSGEEVKLVLTFGGKAPEMAVDGIVDSIDALGNHVKVYGAMASDAFTFRNYRVACNEKIEMAAQVLILITGNIEPKILGVTSLSGKTNFSYEVTKSKGNLVFGLGNGTFIEALEKEGLSSDKDKEVVGAEYMQTPFITKTEKPGGFAVEALRCLTMLDHDSGSGMFLGGIAEGSSLGVGLVNKECAQKTVKEAFDEILDWMKEDGKECSTILCFSCVARLMVLGNNGAIEAESFQGRLPEDVSLMGFYSYGEICPVGDEEWYNVFHNYTFTILCI